MNFKARLGVPVAVRRNNGIIHLESITAASSVFHRRAGELTILTLDIESVRRLDNVIFPIREFA